MTNKEWFLGKINSMSDVDLGNFLNPDECDECYARSICESKYGDGDVNCCDVIAEWLSLEHKK